VVTFALLALAVTGCSSSGDEPKSLPSLTAGSTPSATPVPVPVPGPARVHNAFGAAAFVRFYYQQLNAAYDTPDPSLLRPLSDPECGTCKSYMQAASQFKSDGERVQGVSVRVVSAEAPPEVNGFVAVDAFFDAPTRQVVDTSGKVVRSLPAEPRYHRTVFVKRVPEGWLLRAVKDSV
jgi:hypothetical protein